MGGSVETSCTGGAGIEYDFAAARVKWAPAARAVKDAPVLHAQYRGSVLNFVSGSSPYFSAKFAIHFGVCSVVESYRNERRASRQRRRARMNGWRRAENA